MQPLVDLLETASTLVFWTDEMRAKSQRSLMECLNDIEDPRRPSNGTRHDVREMLVVAIAAMLADCDTIAEIAEWGQEHEPWLRRFLVLRNGVASADTFERLFRMLDPKHFEHVFRRWVGDLVPALNGTVAIDGKCVRGSGSADNPPLHMVSAYATELGLILGQEKVADKSNEITAIPELLEALALRGLLVSIDAMGCQKTIAAAIRARGADYLLAVKANQPSLSEAIEIAFISAHDRPGAGRHSSVEGSHGRVVGQVASVLDARGVVDTQQWPDCRTIGRIDSLRDEGDKEATELQRRYFISSRELSAEALAQAVRAHWGIENGLHWMLDVSFGEDASTVRSDYAPQNLSLLKKMVLNLIRTDTTPGKKCSLAMKRKRAAWNPDLRMSILGLTPL